MQTDEPGKYSFYTPLTSFTYSDPIHNHNHMNNFDFRPIETHPPVDESCARDFTSYPHITSIPLPDPMMYTSPPFACPGNPPSAFASSFDTMLRDYQGLPVDTGAKWAPRVDPAPQEWGAMSSIQSLPRFGNELSLSLTTSRNNSFPLEQCSEMSSSGVTLPDRRIIPKHASSSGNKSITNSYKPVPLPSLSSGPSFLHAMQEILSEMACHAIGNAEGRVDSSFSSTCAGGDGLDGDSMCMVQERDVETKCKHLLALLQLVDDQYSQCVDEIHTVTSAFHAVTELDPSLHARFAFRAVSFMYKNLREKISSHILAIGAHHNESKTRAETSFEKSFAQKQWALQQLSKRDHQFGRPQRGLPEKSVSVLRAWMFQNFLHPYPKDAEKHWLALRSGLTRNQVSNWFINARVRLWKPMIEEMCAEMNRHKARRNNDAREGNSGNYLCFDTRRFTMN